MHYSYYKRPLLLLLILYIIGLFLFYTPHPKPTDISHFITSETVTLTGKVIGFPTLKKHKHHLVLAVSEANGQPATGKVYARLETQAPRWHETVRVSGKLKKPYSVNLLGNFDWAGYLATKNIFTEMQVEQVDSLSAPSWFFRFIAAVRQDILDTFEQSFDRKLSAIAGGVLLGERGEIDEQLYTDFQDSGAIHLLVASGGNVGFVTLLVFAFCGLFAVQRRKTVFMALVISGIYTLIAGADAPLMRAYFMAVCAGAGYALRRNSGVFQGLLVSCLVILLFNPAAVFETGFQMSFLATLAIIICLNTYEIPYQWPRWMQFFAQIFLATLSTQLILLPIFTNVFFKVSVIGLIANMILVPWASLLMAVSFAFYVLTLLKVGFLLHALTGWLLGGFAWLVGFFASLSFASWTVSAWKTGWIAAYYIGLFLLFHAPQRHFIKRIYKPLVGMMLLAPAVQFLFFNPPTAWLLNEWNKNVILFQSSNGNTWLIGAAIEAEKLVRAVRKSGATRLRAVLISEPTDKQLENVRRLQQKIPIDQVIIAFENIWPGESMQIQDVSLQARWGLLLNRQQKIWENKGYSGQRDHVSYQVSGKNFLFTTAGNERFILTADTRWEQQRNTTQKINLYYNVKTQTVEE